MMDRFEIKVVNLIREYECCGTRTYHNGVHFVVMVTAVLVGFKLVFHNHTAMYYLLNIYHTDNSRNNGIIPQVVFSCSFSKIFALHVR